MSLHVGTGKASKRDQLVEALARGRNDHQFFSWFFLGRKMHDGQADWVENAHATLNVLPTGNRWGKTTVLLDKHFHCGIYKTGGEPKYLVPDVGGFGIDLGKFQRLRYHTIHLAHEWDTAAILWDEALKAIAERAELRAFIKGEPKRSPPVHIDFITGSRWKFRTMGHDSRGIDGNSFYVITIDEAGWLEDLETQWDNVIRVRIADVRGIVWLVGTMKPGISRDFYKFGVRAAAHTGAEIDFTFGQQAEDDDELLTDGGRLDPSILKLCDEFGIHRTELEEAILGRAA